MQPATYWHAKGTLHLVVASSIGNPNGRQCRHTALLVTTRIKSIMRHGDATYCASLPLRPRSQAMAGKCSYSKQILGCVSSIPGGSSWPLAKLKAAAASKSVKRETAPMMCEENPPVQNGAWATILAESQQDASSEYAAHAQTYCLHLHEKTCWHIQ